MRTAILTTVCVGLLIAHSPSSAKDPGALAPSSTWVLDYSEESCRLARSFGDGDEKVSLILAKYAPGTGMEIMVSGKTLAPGSSRYITYAFGNAEPTKIEKPLFGDSGADGTVWQFSGGLIPPDRFEELQNNAAHGSEYAAAEARAAESAEVFKIGIGRKETVLDTGMLAKGIEAMDACLDNLVASWGYDPEQLKTIVQGPEPVGRITSWFNAKDYPDDALREGLSGAVRFRLGIDIQGRVDKCTIQAAFSDPSFADKVCSEFMRKGRFVPAKSAAGEPVPSYWVNTVVFLSS